MTGDDRVRHCQSCQLNIYNTADMTAQEVQHLIENREGRLCIRMYRRADGTVLTKDCPVGLRAVRKRISLVATTALSAVLGLFSVSFAQKDVEPIYRENKLTIERTNSPSQFSQISGSISDPTGALIPQATAKLYKKGEKEPIVFISNDEGAYSFNELVEGVYRFEASASGFKTKVKKNLLIGKQEKVTINVYLDVFASVVIGIFAAEPSIDTTSSSITTTITRRQIEDLPH